MTIEQVKETLRTHLAELLNMDASQIGDEDLLVEDLGAESITIVQLYLSCQDDFGVVISDDLDLYTSQTIQSLSEVVMEKIAEEEA